MAYKFKVDEIIGLSELHAALQNLPTTIEANIMTRALLAGQKIFTDDLKQKTPEETGALKASVRTKFLRKSKKYGYIRTQTVIGSKKAWYAKFIEFGTATYYAGKGQTIGKTYIIRAKRGAGRIGYEAGRKEKRQALRIGTSAIVDTVYHPGVRPKPFVRPTFDSPQNQSAAITATADYIRGRLPREVKKLARLRARA